MNKLLICYSLSDFDLVQQRLIPRIICSFSALFLIHQNFPSLDRDPVVIERGNLVSIMQLVIKEVIDSSLKFGRQLESDHIPLQHFFIVLEHVLRWTFNFEMRNKIPSANGFET